MKPDKDDHHTTTSILPGASVKNGDLHQLKQFLTTLPMLA